MFEQDEADCIEQIMKNVSSDFLQHSAQIVDVQFESKYTYALLDSGDLYYWGGGYSSPGYENNDYKLTPYLMAKNVKEFDVAYGCGAYITYDN